MEDFKIINTEKIQLQSLKNFLSELGYTYISKDCTFYCPYPSAKARSWISLRTACLLHNGNLMDWHGKRFQDGCFENIPEEWIASAKRAKIVHTVHLQHCKRKGNYIRCQKQLVKFIEPDNANLLLKR